MRTEGGHSPSPTGTIAPERVFCRKKTPPDFYPTTVTPHTCPSLQRLYVATIYSVANVRESFVGAWGHVSCGMVVPRGRTFGHLRTNYRTQETVLFRQISVHYFYAVSSGHSLVCQTRSSDFGPVFEF